MNTIEQPKASRVVDRKPFLKTYIRYHMLDPDVVGDGAYKILGAVLGIVLALGLLAALVVWY